MFGENTLVMTNISDTTVNAYRQTRAVLDEIISVKTLSERTFVSDFYIIPLYHTMLLSDTDVSLAFVAKSEFQCARRIRLRSGNPLHGRYISRDCAKINSSPQCCRGHRGLLQRTATVRCTTFRCARRQNLLSISASYPAISLSRARTASVLISRKLLFVYPRRKSLTVRSRGILY